MSIKLKNSFKAKIENDPSRETMIMTIEDICRKVDDGKIVMPIFQTGLRWTEEKRFIILSIKWFCGGFPNFNVSYRLWV